MWALGLAGHSMGFIEPSTSATIGTAGHRHRTYSLPRLWQGHPLFQLDTGVIYNGASVWLWYLATRTKNSQWLPPRSLFNLPNLKSDWFLCLQRLRLTDLFLLWMLCLSGDYVKNGMQWGAVWHNGPKPDFWIQELPFTHLWHCSFFTWCIVFKPEQNNILFREFQMKESAFTPSLVQWQSPSRCLIILVAVTSFFPS